MTMNPWRRWAAPTLVAALMTGLSACGGGGSAAPASQVQSDADGIWQGTSTVNGGTQSAAAVILPDGQAWMLLGDDSGFKTLVQGEWLAKAAALSFSGTAQWFDLQNAGAKGGVINWQGTATAQSELLIHPDATSNPLGEPQFATWRALQSSPALSVVGTWTDQLETPLVSWTIDAQGVLSGNSSACDYSGQLSAPAGVTAVQSLTLTETCGPQITAFKGIVTAGEDAAHRNFSLISTGEPPSALMLSLVAAP